MAFAFAGPVLRNAHSPKPVSGGAQSWNSCHSMQEELRARLASCVPTDAFVQQAVFNRTSDTIAAWEVTKLFNEFWPTCAATLASSCASIK